MRKGILMHFEDIKESLCSQLKTDTNMISYIEDAWGSSENSKDLARKINKAVQIILEVESIAYTIHNLFPEEKSIRTMYNLFVSRDLSVFKNLSPEKQKLLHCVQALCLRWNNKKVAEDCIREYHRFPFRQKHVAFDSLDEDNPLYQGEVCWKSLPLLSRHSQYAMRLISTVEHSTHNTSICKAKELSFSDADGQRYDINLENKERYGFIFESQQSFEPLPIDFHETEIISFTQDDLISAAEQMDEKLGVKTLSTWKSRISNVLLLEPSLSNLSETRDIHIDGTQHWVGKLSVGKSTFMDVASYMLSQRGKISVLVVNTTSEVFAKVDFFEKLGVKAVPLLSHNTTSKRRHIQEYIRSIRGSDGDFFENKAFHYLSDSCLLAGIGKENVQGIVEFKGDYPCKKVHVIKADGEIQKKESYCPYVAGCEFFNAFHDLRYAQIIITTQHTLIKSTMPAPFVKENMTYLEYLHRRAHVVFVDESDRVQDTFDREFVNELSLWDKQGGWLVNVMNRFYELALKGTTSFAQDEQLLRWINNLHICIIQTNKVINFLLDPKQKNHKFTRAIEEKRIFSARKLWFDVVEKVAREIASKAACEKPKELEDEIKMILMHHFRLFMKSFDKRDSEKHVQMHNIAHNTTSESKQIEDINKFINEDIFELLGDELKKKNGFSELDIKPDIRALNAREDIDKQIYLSLTLALLETKLRAVVDGLPIVLSTVPRLAESEMLFSDSSRKFKEILPLPLISVRFGFRFENDEGSPSLKFFSYTGVGRYLLSNFSYLYEKLDGHRGAHCVLLSGTSFVPGSPKYHIPIPIRYLLKSRSEKPVEVTYKFLNLCEDKVSGNSEEGSAAALQKIAQKLLETSILSRGESEFSRILSRLEPARRRILGVTGSYKEAECISKAFNAASKERVSGVSSIPLGRAQSDEETARVARQKLPEYANDHEHEMLTAPQGATDRGHNILIDKYLAEDDYSQKLKVAAFGAAIFFKRPFSTPDDFGDLANVLNSRYMEAILTPSKSFGNIQEEVNHLRGIAYSELQNFEKRKFGYATLSTIDRERLLATTFASTWQLEGRLQRGGVGAHVYFAESSFAPNTALGVKKDTVNTSMLLGWKYMWKELLENPFDREEELQKTILEELYSIRLSGLKKMELSE